MQIDRAKLDLALAEQCKNLSDLSPALSASTCFRIRNGYNVTTKTAGKLAQVLGVPLERLIAAKEA